MEIKVADGRIELRTASGVFADIVLQQNNVVGIGKVTWQGKELRSAEECIMPEIATPDGLAVDHYELVRVVETGDRASIVTKPVFRVGHRMEWSEHALHLRVNTSPWTRNIEPPEGACLEWVFREENETFDSVEYSGFSYGFRYECPGYPIYQIEDKATWELGGTAVGNTFIMKGGTNPPITEMSSETSFFTGWDLPGIANPHIFQHMPLYTGLQGFTFQYDADHTLITLHEKPSHVRSLFQKSEQDDKLLHFNQFCFDLTDRIETPARKILAAHRPSASRTDAINHYLRVRDAIQTGIRAYYNVMHDKVRPSAHVETWAIGNPDNFGPIFELLHEWGINRSYVLPMWRSNETEVVPRFKNDRDRFGILGNMCCPLELEIAECYGGWEGLERHLAKAVELGIDTYMWFGSHFSSLSPLESRIKDIFAKDVSGQNNRNNYGHVLFAVNQNSKEFEDYFINAYARAKECGLKGIFRDSHFNMASDTINYLHGVDQGASVATLDQIGFLGDKSSEARDMILSMHDAEIRIQSRFQNELGMLYYVESPGMMGAAMCGTDYDFIRGNEFVYTNMETGMNLEKVRVYGDDPEEVYFRGMSVRLFYQIHVEMNDFPDKKAIESWWNPETMVPLVKAYHKVEPYMVELHVLEDGRGVLWKGGGADVLYAYDSFDYDCGEAATVADVIGDEVRSAKPEFQAEKMHIYLIWK